MFFKIVNFKICNRRHTALGQCRIGFLEGSLAYQRYPNTLAGYFQGKTHTGDAGTDDKIVVFVFHKNVLLMQIPTIWLSTANLRKFLPH